MDVSTPHGIFSKEGTWTDHSISPHSDIESYESTDKALTAFLEACFEAGGRCALARPNATAASFEEEFYDWLDDLKYHPIPGPGFLLDYTAMKSWTLGLLYEPRAFNVLAEIIHGAMTGNLTLVGEGFRLPLTSAEGRIGIVCGDKTARTSRMDDVLPYVDELHQLSRLGGETADSFVMQCARWQMKAKERYTGDYNVETRNPILAIGNTYDPITPWVSALNASQSFPSSVALKQNGIGHCSVAQASICTVKAIQAYLMNGTMPEPGTVCEIDEPPFSDLSWEDILTDLS